MLKEKEKLERSQGSQENLISTKTEKVGVLRHNLLINLLLLLLFVWDSLNRFMHIRNMHQTYNNP